MLRVMVTGLNGYGKNFVRELLEKGTQKGYQLVGVISQSPQKSEYYEQLKQQNINIYPNLEEAFLNQKAEVVIVATPAHIHAKEVKEALENGAHVFCEKPLTPTVDEALEIEALAKEKGLKVAVGYQWSYAEPIQMLKKDLLEGRFGKIQKVKALVNWNRPKSYFTSSNWKGKNKDHQGNYVLDCVLSNNTAHYLHNLFFLLGEKMPLSDWPCAIVAEGYQGHPFAQSYDTTCLKIKTKRGYEILYLATIVAKEEEKPKFMIECEQATIHYNTKGMNNEILVEMKDATTKEEEPFSFGEPDQRRFEDIFAAMDQIQKGETPICSIQTTLPHLVVVNALKDAIVPTPFPTAMICEEGDTVYIKDLPALLSDCFEKDQLPSEAGILWAKSALIDVEGYKHFTGNLLK